MSTIPWLARLTGVLLFSHCCSVFATEAQTPTLTMIKPTAMPSATLDLSKPITRFAVGSCFAPSYDQSVFDSIAQNQPQAFLFIGDNVYQSKENEDLALPYLKAAYQQLAEVPSFTRLREATPVLPIWDDHDYGMNDAGANYPPRLNSEQLFEQVWAIDSNDERAQRPGVYFSRTVGPIGQRVQFILLDTRFFRSEPLKFNKPVNGKKYQSNDDPQATMLGQAQWQWLEQQLQQPAEVRFLVSTVQVLMDNGLSEGWYTFGRQRQRLLDLLSKTDNVIILSGDKHFANFYQYPRKGRAPLVEFTSSSLNFPMEGDWLAQWQVLDENYQTAKGIFGANFGLISLSWPDKTVTMEIRGSKNELLRTMAVKF